MPPNAASAVVFWLGAYRPRSNYALDTASGDYIRFSNFHYTLATLEPVKFCSATTLKQRLESPAKVVSRDAKVTGTLDSGRSVVVSFMSALLKGGKSATIPFVGSLG